MTPLAWELFEDLYSRQGVCTREPPFSDRQTWKFLDNVMREVKFFELTAVIQLATHLARDMYENYEAHDSVDQRHAFLPAPMTWLEIESPSMQGLVDDRSKTLNEFVQLKKGDMERVSHYYRSAFVLLGRGDSTHIADRYQIQYETPRLPGPRIWRIYTRDPLPLVDSGLKPKRSLEHYRDGAIRRYDKPVAAMDDFIHYAMLALINSPRVIGQHNRYPHGRLERNMLKNAKLIGKFPLRAWTEILLQVTPDPRQAGEREAHFTGERCLHYCRTYLRVRLGQLEYVEGHWRGNPALGMKRSRYRVE